MVSRLGVAAFRYAVLRAYGATSCFASGRAVASRVELRRRFVRRLFYLRAAMLFSTWGRLTGARGGSKPIRGQVVSRLGVEPSTTSLKGKCSTS